MPTQMYWKVSERPGISNVISNMGWHSVAGTTGTGMSSIDRNLAISLGSVTSEILLYSLVAGSSREMAMAVVASKPAAATTLTMSPPISGARSVQSITLSPDSSEWNSCVWSPCARVNFQPLTMIAA